MTTKSKAIIVIAVAVVLLIGVSALLKFRGRERTIVGDYQLEQFEDFTTYYLHQRGQDDSSQGGSIIGGVVLRIGWSSRYIVAERSSIFRGDPDGWMIIDLRTRAIAGPFTDAIFRERPESQDIQIYGAAEAWKKL